jgi:hypothetical protein
MFHFARGSEQANMSNDADAVFVDTAAGPENGRYKDHITQTRKSRDMLNAG